MSLKLCKMTMSLKLCKMTMAQIPKEPACRKCDFFVKIMKVITDVTIKIRPVGILMVIVKY